MAKRSIVLGVSGGISAYKTADLCSKLTQYGFDVHVIMTTSACKLVTPLTFTTLSRNPVTTDLYDLRDWRPEHVALADTAEFAIIAPATVNIIGKYANGIADDALSTFLATFRKTVYLAPAMNPNMFAAPALLKNLETLKSFGVNILGPDTGHVACGENGKGRMISPEEIFSAVTLQPEITATEIK